MSEQLKYEWDFDLSKAEKQFNQWLSKAEAKLADLGKKASDKTAKATRDVTSGLDSRRRRRGEERDEAQSARMQARKVEKEWKGAFARIEQFRRRHPLISDQDVNQAIARLKRLQNTPAAQRMGFAGGAASRELENLRDSNRGAVDTNKAIREAQRASDAVARAQANAKAMVHRAATISAETRVSLMSQAEQQITATVTANAGQRVSVLQAELNRELGMIRQKVAAAVGAAQQTQQAQMAGITRMNKMNMGMFAVQQGIEDYSFAGFRGVSNNLAMLASMMGGPAGLAAMAGMTAVSLGYMFSTMKSGDSVVEGHKDRLERLIEAHYDLRQSRDEAFRDVSTKDTMDVAGSRRDTSKDIYDTNTAIKEQITLREELMTVQHKAQEARQLDKDLKAMWWQIDTAGRGNVGVPQRLFDELERLEKEKARVLSDVSGIVGQPVTDLEQLAEAEKVAAERAGQSSEEIGNLRLELEKLEGLKGQSQALEKFLEPLERLASFEMPSSFGDFGEFSGSSGLGKYASEYEKRITDAYANSVAARQEMDTTSLDALQQRYGEALKARDFDSASAVLKQQEELLQSQVDDLEMLKESTEELVQIENERLTAIAEVQDLASETVSALEEQIEKTKDLVRAEQERIEKLKEAKKESRESYGGKRFGMDKTLLDKRSEFEADRIKKRADADRAELERFKAANKNNPQAMAWAEAQERAINRREERDLKTVEKKKGVAERKLYDDREILLKRRADAEVKAAEEAQKAGDSALASKRFGKARDTLEELQQLQEEQVSSRPLPEAEAASGRADATQNRLEDVFDKEMKAAAEQEAKNRQQQQELQTQLETAKALKKEVESIPFISEADIDAVTRMKADFQELLALKQQIAATQAAAGGEFGLGGVPARAGGGPVTMGQTYLVGENGPELFTAAASGSIHSTRDTRGILNSVASMFSGAGSDGASAITNNNTHFGTVNVQTVGAPNLEDLQRRAAWAAKSARIRES